ncbi:MAG: SufBD protein [Oscillospiraceae bacterium]|nr:SufBD protein [Oscillospiraceae bacterium]
MQEIIEKLTAKDDKFACAIADRILAESRESDTWYEYFDAFASLLNHPKSLVRNRALHILAANAQWDEENRFDTILPEYLSHVTDEKPITARQCIQALSQVGLAKPQYIPQILSRFHSADLSGYKDSMRPLIEKDMAETEKALTA